MNLCEPRFDDNVALSRGEAERDCPQAKGDTAESREVGLTEIENYQHAREISSPHSKPRARFNVFVRQYISIVICSVTFTCLPQKNVVEI